MKKELAAIWDAVGGLSAPSKMPCYGFSIPAWECKTGIKLRSVEGSVCSKCYALKGRYSFPKVQRAMDKRFLAIFRDDWVANMTTLIQELESSGYFRWHDSGDLQSLEHLQNIVQIAKNLPNIRFWLPTREYAIVGKYVEKHGSFPANLTVRLSALMLEGQPPVAIAKRYGVTTSGVSKFGFTCPSPKQGGKCLDCRACWNANGNISYKQH